MRKIALGNERNNLANTLKFFLRKFTGAIILKEENHFSMGN